MQIVAFLMTWLINKLSNYFNMFQCLCTGSHFISAVENNKLFAWTEGVSGESLHISILCSFCVNEIPTFSQVCFSVANQ